LLDKGHHFFVRGGFRFRQCLKKRQDSGAIRKGAARDLAHNEGMNNHPAGAQQFRQMPIATAQVVYPD